MAESGVPLLAPEVRRARARFFEELSRLQAEELKNRDLEERGLPRKLLNHRRLVDYAVGYARALPDAAIQRARDEVEEFDELLNSALHLDGDFAQAARAASEWLGCIRDFFDWPLFTKHLFRSLINRGQVAGEFHPGPSGKPLRLEYHQILDVRRSLEQLLSFKREADAGDESSNEGGADPDEWSVLTVSRHRFSLPIGHEVLTKWLDETKVVLSKLSPLADQAEALNTLLRLHDAAVESERAENIIDLDVTVIEMYQFDDYIRLFETSVLRLESHLGLNALADAGINDPIWLSLAEAGNFTGMSAKTVSNWIHDGQIAAVKRGKKFAFSRDVLKMHRDANNAEKGGEGQ